MARALHPKVQMYLKYRGDMPFERETPKFNIRPDDVKPVCRGQFFAIPFASHVKWGFEYEDDAKRFDDLVKARQQKAG